MRPAPRTGNTLLCFTLKVETCVFFTGWRCTFLGLFQRKKNAKKQMLIRSLLYGCIVG